MSLNHHTPEHLCSVKYNDLDKAVVQCLEVKQHGVRFDEVNEEEPIFLGKSDIKSTFCLIPLSILCWRWLVMIAQNPINKKWQYFIDKCLPFGASISCSIFQKFSDALKHVAQFRSKRMSITNYLDDFLFIAYKQVICNQMIQTFVDMCEEFGVPLAFDKTEWACIQIVFLGILIDGKNMILAIPEDKRLKAVNLLKKFVHKRKATIHELQQLCGYLNFLNKAIHPGRVFMRRMYAKYALHWDKKLRSKSVQGNQKILKSYHHVQLDKEFKSDCQVWLHFLTYHKYNLIINRPMIDLDMFDTSDQLRFYSNASAAKNLGYGCIFGTKWIFRQWEPFLIQQFNPSIEFLEMFALCAGILTWQKDLANRRIIIYCDNMGVVNMINNNASKCRRCMYLLRILTLNGLIHNRRISVKYVSSKNNFLSDALSRLDFKQFQRLGPEMDDNPCETTVDLLPVSRILQLADNSI